MDNMQMSDISDNLSEIVKAKNSESEAYFRQWIVWLGVGSAGGAIALSSLAAHLPDPDYAFKLVIPSLWLFLLGVVLAGSSIFALSQKLSAMAQHFAETHNRDGLKRIISSIPEVMAVPQSLADRQNSERNKYIAQHDKCHILAEKAWGIQLIWSRILVVCSTSSALLFIAGIALPLAQISLGKTLKP